MHLPLSTLANSQTVSVIITDTQGLATWVNEATERLSGYSAVEFIGRKPGAVLQCERTDPLTIERMGGAVRDRQPVAVQVLNRRKDGSDYWTRLQILPWDDEQGRPIGFVSFQFDATQEKEAMDAARAHGIRAVVTKPFSIEALGLTIHDGSALTSRPKSPQGSSRASICQQPALPCPFVCI